MNCTIWSYLRTVLKEVGNLSKDVFLAIHVSRNWGFFPFNAALTLPNLELLSIFAWKFRQKHCSRKQKLHFWFTCVPKNVFTQASYNQSEILSFRVKQNSVIPRNYLVYLAQMWLWSWSLLLFCGLIIEWCGHASGQNVWRPMGRQALTSLSLKLEIYPLSPLESMFRQALSVVYCFDLRDRRQKRSYCISRTPK